MNRTRRRVSVRSRAAIAAIGALLPVLAAAAVVGVLVQRHQLEQSVQLVAEEQARSVVREVEADASDGVTSPPPFSTILGGEESLVQVVDGTGRVVYATTALRGAEPIVLAPSLAVRRSTVDGGVVGEEGPYAAVAVPVDGGGYVVAARSLESVQEATQSTIGLFAVGVPLVVAVVALLSWLLVGRALSPVEALRGRASAITETGSGSRLPVEPTGDEVERLALTLNAMLARLDASARAQQRFVADASHELRSPVAAIRAVMEVAPAGSPEWEEARVDVVHETVRLESLVSGLITLARRDAGSRAQGASRTVLRLRDVIAPEVGRPRRTPVGSTVLGDPWVAGDADALRRLVANLLDNAARHARSAVTVTVDLDGSEAVLVVSDDGAGVPPTEAEHIFERFVRLDESRARDAGGAGLGLAIARAIATEHHGDLRLAPTTGAGAEFVLRLPAVPPTDSALGDSGA